MEVVYLFYSGPEDSISSFWAGEGEVMKVDRIECFWREV